MLMGVPAATPAVDSTPRWRRGLPALIGAVRYASRQAASNPDWVGSTQIFTRLAVIGNLVSFGASDGAQVPRAGGSAQPRPRPRRGVATRDNRMVLLRLPEVSFAESDGNDVWLSTDQGRLRAASAVLDKFDGANTMVPVSRRNVAAVRRALDI
ncbi:hypothetical protein [Amycolatopsis methanolica]|uniref:hypothetical protein n=1 Tax=Amycolatopsis methanolica TaxID=1814 RepID=UPI000A41867C|nr:hypothetical protein [Amycolatopsis methanolica]